MYVSGMDGWDWVGYLWVVARYRTLFVSIMMSEGLSFDHDSLQPFRHGSSKVWRMRGANHRQVRLNKLLTNLTYIFRALRAFDKQWHIKCFVCSVNITFSQLNLRKDKIHLFSKLALSFLLI